MSSYNSGIKYESRHDKHNAKGFRVSHLHNNHAREMLNANSMSNLDKADDDVYNNMAQDHEGAIKTRDNSKDSLASIGLKPIGYQLGPTCVR